MTVKIRRSSANTTLPQQPWQEMPGWEVERAVLEFARQKVLGPLFEQGIVPREGSLLLDVHSAGILWEWRVLYALLEGGRLELQCYPPLAHSKARTRVVVEPDG